jgi:hypothetical protein
VTASLSTPVRYSASAALLVSSDVGGRNWKLSSVIAMA